MLSALKSADGLFVGDRLIFVSVFFLSVSKSLCTHSVVSVKLLSLLCIRDCVRVHVPQLKLPKYHRYKRKFKSQGMAMNCLFLTGKRLKIVFHLRVLRLTSREDWIELSLQTIGEFSDLNQISVPKHTDKIQCREGTTGFS